LVLEFVGKKMLPFGFSSMFPAFLKIMAQHVVKKRMEALNITKFFSLLFDETTDVSHLEVVMFFIVYLDLNLKCGHRISHNQTSEKRSRRSHTG
jgi:hypothetical protein